MNYDTILWSRVISGNIWLPSACYALLKFCVTKDFFKGGTFHPSPRSSRTDIRGSPRPASAVTSLQLFPVHPISLPDWSNARLSGKKEFLAVFYFRQWWQLRYTQRVSFNPLYIIQNEVYFWPVLAPFMSSSSLTWMSSLALLPFYHPCVGCSWDCSVFWACQTALIVCGFRTDIKIISFFFFSLF